MEMDGLGDVTEQPFSFLTFVCACVRSSEEGLEYPGSGVTGGSELCYVAAGNCPWVL